MNINCRRPAFNAVDANCHYKNRVARVKSVKKLMCEICFKGKHLLETNDQICVIVKKYQALRLSFPGALRLRH